MSKKLTKSQIEKIISEEITNILTEAKIDDLIALAQKTFGKPGKIKGMQKVQLLRLKRGLANIEDLTPEKAKELLKILDANRAAFVNTRAGKMVFDRQTAALQKVVDDAAAIKTGSQTLQKLKNFASRGAAPATIATAAGLGLSGVDSVPTADASRRGKEADPKVPGVDKDKGSDDSPKKTAKKSETPKQRRTRIAHATVKGKDKVDSIKTIQKRLQKLGYDLGKFGPNKDGIDGDYGDTTVKAVKAFQESNGLTGDQADGIVGNNTWKKLSSKNANGPSPGGPVMAFSDDEVENAELLSKLPPLFGKGNEILRKIYNEKGDDYRFVFRLYRAFQKEIRKRLYRKARANDIDRLTRVKAFNKALPIQGQIGIGAGRTGETNSEQVSRKLLSRIGRVLSKGLVMLGNIYTDDSSSITPEEGYEAFYAAVFNDTRLKPIVLGYISDSIDLPARPSPKPDDPVDIKELEESKKYNLNFDKWSKLWE